MGDSQFLVMLETQASRAEVVATVLQAFPGAVRRKENSCDINGNWLEVWANEDSDSQSASDEEDGFLYYRWRVEVTPNAKEVNQDVQVELACGLKECFEQSGGAAVVCAEFEDRL